jgi:hypothetical protein
LPTKHHKTYGRFSGIQFHIPVFIVSERSLLVSQSWSTILSVLSI